MNRLGGLLIAVLLLLAGCAGDDEVDIVDEGDSPAEVADVTTTTGAQSTRATTTQPASTAVPTTRPVATSPPTTHATATATSTTVTAKPTTTAPLVSFAEFSVSAPLACPSPDVSVQLDPPQVTVKWKLAGVIPDDVYVAVDNENGAYQSGLPAQGEISLSHSCDEQQHTYYVVAVVGGQKFVKSQKI